MRLSARAQIGRAAGLACAWGLRTLAHRRGSTLPGRVALALDPSLIAHLAGKCQKGSVVVCGTNGKTTTTNLLARSVAASGAKVLCNWDGANMATGVASALLPDRSCDWGVFENDELSTIAVVPSLKPRLFVLLNLFRDQLDRSGEIDRVQDVITRALAASPQTVLLYNGDDPLCEGIARRVGGKGGNPTLAFGVEGSLGLGGDRVVGGGFCQVCGAPLAYTARQYGQLGTYSCTKCDFARPRLAFLARGARLSQAGVALDVWAGGSQAPGLTALPQGRLASVVAKSGGPYMVYNLLAVCSAALLLGVGPDQVQGVLDAYVSDNGRLQEFDIDGRRVVLNLAKNPTGFNQNLALLAMNPAPKLVYVVINDDYNDGKDVSWLWDVDFERLSGQPDNLICLVGGHRANDMQVRMKYAGVSADIKGSVAEALDRARDLPAGWDVYVLTNYSALRPAREELVRAGGWR